MYGIKQQADAGGEGDAQTVSDGRQEREYQNKRSPDRATSGNKPWLAAARLRALLSLVAVDSNGISESALHT